jgi:hypothetical protein
MMELSMVWTAEKKSIALTYEVNRLTRATPRRVSLD